MTRSEQSFKKYIANVQARGYQKLSKPTREETLDELIAAGNRLLEKDIASAKVSPKSSSPPKLDLDAKNPYLRARTTVLMDMSDQRRKRLLEMEAEKNTNNPVYDEFVRLVIKLGDQFSA